MLHFSKLRLQGFKSFVDKTELEIAPGLNGIVGPNGCGKSNLVEALRWVMGESSAKRMRGSGMEAVIFNGTDKRSARNNAEVSLLLDNKDRSAPPAYNGDEQIEVTRKIERDRGSLYKINGKTVRARDVQMLFADTVTGANSPALVSQGRVAEIINAKPQSRRQILEESAGISGLYARRHEAELRLRSADRNLQRLEDILGGLETQLNSLKRQARQATKYRNLGAQIRQLDIQIAHTEWSSLSARIADLKEKFTTAESVVADKLALVTQLTRTQTTQSADLPALRKAEAEAAAALQVQKITLQRLEEDAARHKAELEETLAHISQTKSDHAHEQSELTVNTQKLTDLEQEFENLSTRQKTEAERLPELEKTRDNLERTMIALEEQYTTLMKNDAESKARKEALERQIEQNETRIEKLQSRKNTAQQDLQDLKDAQGDVNELDDLQAKIENLFADKETIDKEIEETSENVRQIKDRMVKAREHAKEAERGVNALQTEISTLESFLDTDENGTFKPMLEDVKAQSGFETALSRALGDSLMASTDDNAPSHWQSRDIDMKGLPDLPHGVEKMLNYVDAPDILRPALSQIGYVSNIEIAQEVLKHLKMGQSLVTTDGTYFRWDGYTIKAQATDRNARHLEQKNKLEILKGKAPELEQKSDKAIKGLEKLQSEILEHEEKLEELRTRRGVTERSLAEARQSHSNLRESSAKHESNINHLNDVIKTTDEDIATLKDVIKWDTERLNTHNETTDESAQNSIEDLKQSLQVKRGEHQDAVRQYDQMVQKDNSRKARLHAIADERINLKNRAIRSNERIKDMDARLENLNNKLKTLEDQPVAQDNGKDDLLSKINALEETRNAAAEKLATVETEVTETTKALKEVESILSDARETRAAAQATLSGIIEQQQILHGKIIEQFDMAPERLVDHIASNNSEYDLDTLKVQRETLHRQRDGIGAVNLRAEEELQALEEQTGGILTEREDLMKAIAELRKGIDEINEEARERLARAFDTVNGHFQYLFTKLFNGGKASLELIDSDDPLEAGLEIYAQPPGKARQSLSLLSGGEQALTSIALIFGMFLTNPSPICVMDEIDAPLDDANVDRVCNMLDDICARSETRFIIITHHRLTMSRMDRLYGVTMAEHGVSQLVSVDLQQSFEFLEAA